MLQAPPVKQQPAGFSNASSHQQLTNSLQLHQQLQPWRQQLPERLIILLVIMQEQIMKIKVVDDFQLALLALFSSEATL